MVDAAQAKKKLPSLLVGNCSSRNKQGWKEYMRTRYRISSLKANNPKKYEALTNRFIAVLNDIEKAIN